MHEYNSVLYTAKACSGMETHTGTPHPTVWLIFNTAYLISTRMLYCVLADNYLVDGGRQQILEKVTV